MIYENKVIDTTQIDFVLNIKMLCIPFVCLTHYVDQRIAPSVVSMLPDPCHQISHIYLWNVASLQPTIGVSKIKIHILLILIMIFMEYLFITRKHFL